MLSFHFSSFVRHNCPTQILQNLGDANRKSNYATPLFCDNFFFFFGGGGKKQEQASYLASCFRAVGLINCNVRNEIYISSI